MTNQAISVPSMHEDHRNWQSEYSMWLQDLSAWQKQIATGLRQLVDLQQILAHQQNIMIEHRSTIAAHETILKAYEQDLAACEHFGMEYQDSLSKKHQVMAEQINKQREAHERIKKYHHRLLAKLEQLEKTMDAPM